MTGNSANKIFPTVCMQGKHKTNSDSVRGWLVAQHPISLTLIVAHSGNVTYMNSYKLPENINFVNIYIIVQILLLPAPKLTPGGSCRQNSRSTGCQTQPKMQVGPYFTGTCQILCRRETGYKEVTTSEYQIKSNLYFYCANIPSGGQTQWCTKQFCVQRPQFKSQSKNINKWEVNQIQRMQII